MARTARLVSVGHKRCAAGRVGTRASRQSSADWEPSPRPQPHIERRSEDVDAMETRLEVMRKTRGMESEEGNEKT